MERLKKILLRLVHPGITLSVLLSVICAAALVYVFVAGQEETIMAYVVYALTTYALTVFAINTPEMAAKIKAHIYKNKLGNRYMTDIPYRAKLTLYISLSFNMLYAAFKLIAGIHYASFWYGADAIYYVVLSVALFLLIRYMRKNENDLIKGFRQYRLIGYLIFVLNIALIGVVYQIVNQGMGYQYPGLMIYAVATFTFYCVTMSVINVVKYRKYNNPVLSAQKAITFTKALVAMFALQTAMFASFNDNIVLERTMNSIFGGLVCCTIFAIAVIMVIQATKNLKKLKINNSETHLA